MPSAPARMTSAAFDSLMPPMAMSLWRERAPQFPQTLKTPCRLQVRLRRRGKDGAHAEVVHVQALRVLGLSASLDRETDEHLLSDEPPNGAIRHVALTDMNAVRLNRKSDVHAIVNDERHAVAVEHSLRLAGNLHELAC